MAVVVEVATGDAHRRAAIFHPGGGSDVSEGAVAVVTVEDVAAELVSYVQIRVAVVVVISPRSGEAPCRTLDAGAGGDVDERAVAVVAVQRVGNAIAGFPVRLRRRVLVISHAQQVEIEEAVAIIVRDQRHAAPAAGFDTGDLGDVGETPAALVAVQLLAADTADEEVRGAVIVEIEKHQTGGGDVQRIRQPHRERRLAEGAVAVVAVHDQARGAEQRHVLEAVAVDVGDGTSRAGVVIADQPKAR